MMMKVKKMIKMMIKKMNKVKMIINKLVEEDKIKKGIR